MTRCTPPHDRGAGRGEIRGCACNIVSEGTDIPTVTGCRCCGRPPRCRYLQVARAFAQHRQDAAIILDHVGNVHEHGCHHKVEWTLEGKKRRKTDRPKAPSVQCVVFRRNRIQARPVPGVWRSSRKEDTNDRKHRGQPEEMDHKAMRAMEAIERRKKMDLRREVGRARSLQQLKAIAQQRGYAQAGRSTFTNRGRKWPAMSTLSKTRSASP